MKEKARLIDVEMIKLNIWKMENDHRASKNEGKIILARRTITKIAFPKKKFFYLRRNDGDVEWDDINILIVFS